jgi:hypothetical protein
MARPALRHGPRDSDRKLALPGPGDACLIEKCRPDWDITTPELKAARQQGTLLRKLLYSPQDTDLLTQCHAAVRPSWIL